MKYFHEIRDPIHNFIKIESPERKILNSWSMQRLRYINQLAMTYLVYPGATHRRFEHSLGVMELATRIFDVVTNPVNLITKYNEKDLFGSNINQRQRLNWRAALRMAALLHDVGHLPFSHAGETALLPDGWNHEKITVNIILSDEMRELIGKLDIDPIKVAKIAVGPDKFRRSFPDANYTIEEELLSEIITNDNFGADRIDYLLRDSHHAGVAYGKFDHYRLIDTLRILPKEYEEGLNEPTLGIESGGLHTAESLILARYFMFKQLYFHRVRRIYDIHLKDFLVNWLPDGHYPTDLDEFLTYTDCDVISALYKELKSNNNDPAMRILKRKHFKYIFERTPDISKTCPEAAEAVFDAAKDEFGENNLRLDSYEPEEAAQNFPVIDDENVIHSSLQFSDVLKKIPSIGCQYVFVNPDIEHKAQKWLNDNRESILKFKKDKIT